MSTLVHKIMVLSFDERGYDRQKVSISWDAVWDRRQRGNAGWRADCQEIADSNFALVIYVQCAADGKVLWSKAFLPTPDLRGPEVKFACSEEEVPEVLNELPDHFSLPVKYRPSASYIDDDETYV